MLREFVSRFNRHVFKCNSPGCKSVIADDLFLAFKHRDKRLPQASLFVLADASSDEIIER